MTPQEAKHQLRHNPDHFLKYYPVKTAGWPAAHNPNAVNLHGFVIYKQNPGNPGTMPSGKVAHFGATRPGMFGTNEIASWKVDDQPPPATNTHPIQAHSVPMLTYDGNAAVPLNHAQLDSYQLDGSGDGVMITGQLSGCCFCWIVVGATLLCTHIRPVNYGGVQLHNLLNVNGRFTGHGGTPLNTFGRGDYPAHATVIGVRVGGQWRLYAQLSNDLNKTNAQVLRLHPGPRAPL